jgi:hypothetical protein
VCNNPASEDEEMYEADSEAYDLLDENNGWTD